MNSVCKKTLDNIQTSATIAKYTLEHTCTIAQVAIPVETKTSMVQGKSLKTSRFPKFVTVNVYRYMQVKTVLKVSRPLPVSVELRQHFEDKGFVFTIQWPPVG